VLVSAAELLLGQFLGLLDALVHLVRMLARQFLGLLKKLTELWHDASPFESFSSSKAVHLLGRQARLVAFRSPEAEW
jgi:hypothetical protein